MKQAQPKKPESEKERVNRLVYAVGVGCFGVALLAGVTQSMRTEGRLPAVDLLKNGSSDYIDRLVATEDHKGAIHELQMHARMAPLDPVRLKLLGTLQAKELVKQRPDDAEAHLFLGTAYLQTDEPAAALGAFRRALELEPRLAAAYYGMGVACTQQERLADAEKAFAKAVELAPDVADARARLDGVREAMRDHKSSR